MMSSAGVGGRAPFRRGAAMDRRRRRGPGEQVRGGHRGLRRSRRPGETRPRLAGCDPPRPGVGGARGARLGYCPASGRGPLRCRAPVPGRGAAGPPASFPAGPWGRCTALVGRGVNRMRSAVCPARGTGPAHPTPPHRRSAPVPPRLRRAPRGAGGGRGWRWSWPGRWLPAARLGKVDPGRAGAAPAAPRGWAPAAAESEPPEIPVPLIPRCLRTGVPAGRSLPFAPLPGPGRHTPLPRVPRRQEPPASASAGHGTGSQPRSGARGAAAGSVGSHRWRGAGLVPRPPWFDPGSSSVEYRCFQAPNLWIRKAVPKGAGIYRAGELF